MRQSPKLRPTVWDLFVALAVALLAAGCLLAPGRGGAAGGETLTAVVTVDGTETDRFSLPELADAPRSYSGGGYTLTAEAVTEGAETVGLRVTRSDCPTQDCVRTGSITRSGQSIICLPARIIIRLEGGRQDSGGPDVIIG